MNFGEGCLDPPAAAAAASVIDAVMQAHGFLTRSRSS
ncbi:hypothetical protein BJ991_001821 [Microbacterium immunditiarum]|uniref:Uncharacterized protein n=1 Tax=Microbacterium immunditiarum TaxID=337480 RepID=A0A7Y9KL22_9MICO|nr:hypothetical protein [Microbacterium immunditiarum]